MEKVVEVTVNIDEISQMRDKLIEIIKKENNRHKTWWELTL